MGVLQQAQIGQCMLDFCTFKKPQSPIDAVGHTGIEERTLQYPALCIAAVEQSNLSAFNPRAVKLLSFF